MRRPKTSDCIDEEDNFDAECYAVAIERYEEEERELKIVDEMDKLDQLKKGDSDGKKDTSTEERK